MTPFGRQRALADVDDEERDVEAAFLHLRNVDLRRQPLRVIAFGREVGGIDVVMRVERDHAIVNCPRASDQLRLAGLLGRKRHRTRECGRKRACLRSHIVSFGSAILLERHDPADRLFQFRDACLQILDQCLVFGLLLLDLGQPRFKG